MIDKKNQVLYLDSLEIGFSGKTLLPPINTSASAGELIAVIGRNGIGKSTLLRTILGLQSPVAGRITVNGMEFSTYERLELAKIFGYISTELVNVSNMRVYDLVELGRFPHTNWLGLLSREDHSAVDEALSRTGMLSFSERYISELSDGERQKVMISRILAQNTDIMLMDEPTAFLDITGKFDIIKLMHDLTREGRTIIFSTHDFNVALTQADKIWLLLHDRLVEGAPEDLMISGAFDHLFESDIIGFNSDNGTFIFRNNTMGEIFIEGEGILKFWTEQAIKRNGFTLSEKITVPYIKILSSNTPKWYLVFNEIEFTFDSLYDLVQELFNKS